MPLFNYVCDTCGAEHQRLRAPVPEGIACGKCGQGRLKWKPTGPSAQVVERIDLGTGIRAVERPAEAERLFKERKAASQKDPS